MSAVTLAYPQNISFEDYSPGLGEDAEINKERLRGFYAHAVAAISRQTAESKFLCLAEIWRHDTRYISSVNQICMHSAYQEIIGMGKSALPLIFNELREDPYYWFWALKAITGEDPVRPEDRGKMNKMAESWLKWAREEGYGSGF